MSVDARSEGPVLEPACPQAPCEPGYNKGGGRRWEGAQQSLGSTPETLTKPHVTPPTTAVCIQNGDCLFHNHCKPHPEPPYLPPAALRLGNNRSANCPCTSPSEPFPRPGCKMATCGKPSHSGKSRRPTFLSHSPESHKRRSHPSSTFPRASAPIEARARSTDRVCRRTSSERCHAEAAGRSRGQG